MHAGFVIQPGQMFHRVVTMLLIMLPAAFGWNSVAAEGGASPLAQPAPRFHARTYTTDDGLPQTRVACLAQTPDGYLWCGTYFGLARFDGVRFVTFDRYNTKAFGTSHAVQQLVVDAQGLLWVCAPENVFRHGRS